MISLHLVVLNILFVIMWKRHTLDALTFRVSRIGVITQIITLVAQVYCIVIFGLIGFLVQVLAADQFIRHGESSFSQTARA